MLALLALLSPMIAASHTYSMTRTYEADTLAQKFYTPSGLTYDSVIVSPVDFMWGTSVALSACGIAYGQSDCTLATPDCYGSYDYGRFWGVKIAVHPVTITGDLSVCGGTLGDLYITFS